MNDIELVRKCVEDALDEAADAPYDHHATEVINILREALDPLDRIESVLKKRLVGGGSGDIRRRAAAAARGDDR